MLNQFLVVCLNAALKDQPTLSLKQLESQSLSIHFTDLKKACAIQISEGSFCAQSVELSDVHLYGRSIDIIKFLSNESDAESAIEIKGKLSVLKNFQSAFATLCFDWQYFFETYLPEPLAVLAAKGVQFGGSTAKTLFNTTQGYFQEAESVMLARCFVTKSEYDSFKKDLEAANSRLAKLLAQVDAQLKRGDAPSC